MFGHQDDKDEEDNTAPQQDTHANAVAPNEPAAEPAGQATAPHIAEPSPVSAAGSDDAWQHPGVPLDSPGSEPAPISDVVTPASDGGKSSFQLHTSGGGHTFSDDDGGDQEDGTENTPHELIDIKQKALSQLTPLIDKLDQTPEDKFRTTMMMIQASDDQSLVKQAYESANAIKDEKAKAQALLDIVNEINYFTQHPDN